MCSAQRFLWQNSRLWRWNRWASPMHLLHIYQVGFSCHFQLFLDSKYSFLYVIIAALLSQSEYVTVFRIVRINRMNQCIFVHVERIPSNANWAAQCVCQTILFAMDTRIVHIMKMRHIVSDCNIHMFLSK